MFTISHHLAEHFPHALRRLEQSRDVGELVGFFADDARLSNLGVEHDARGPAGAHHFWQSYLHRFARIRSEFRHLHMSERAFILERRSEGRHADGLPLCYSGVSILAFDPQGKITDFRAYYDSALLVEKATAPTAPPL